MLLSAVAYGKQMQEAKYMFCGSAFFEGLSGCLSCLSRALPVIPSFYVASGSRYVVMLSILSVVGCFVPRMRNFVCMRCFFS